jgi:hypothetical protein
MGQSLACRRRSGLCLDYTEHLNTKQAILLPANFCYNACDIGQQLGVFNKAL